METLALVMPTYNEEGCIAQVIQEWIHYLRKLPDLKFKIIVLNDGSTDKTKAILLELTNIYPELVTVNKANEGHGPTVFKGYQMATSAGYDYIFQIDSDNQFSPFDFLKLWRLRHRSPFILGRRLHRQDPWHRLIISAIARFIIRILFGVKLEDPNIPYRLMEKKFLSHLLMQVPSDSFAPNLMLSVLAGKEGILLFDIPVSHRARMTGKISIMRWRLIKACWQVTKELLALKLKSKSTAPETAKAAA